MSGLEPAPIHSITRGGPSISYPAGAGTARTRIRESGIAGPTVRWNPDAYVDPDPEALLAANPDLRFKENLARLFACDVGGRPECSPQ